MMQFDIEVKTQNGLFKMKVYASSDGTHEIYVITGGNRSITLQNNLPFLQHRNLKNWVPEWSQTNGEELTKNALKGIIEAIELYYNPPPRPRPQAKYIAPDRKRKK